ncbi:SLAP domain-containing protein [Oceanobacillus longus]|uniref:SLAP domain-containing protein n=1 Tax=Oceanobacillus longus TaxID=930120 RepID=A0ABV8GX27_9BACI
MQKLTFETSWDKALPSKDRERIVHIFKETRSQHYPTIKLTPLWQATNHRGELLITVLVHNFSGDIVKFNNTKLRYIEKNKVIAEHAFSIPPLSIPPETSMPWAFIFPVEALNGQASFVNGNLEFAD